MFWLRILAGTVLLVFGQKLFWLFVGLIGFVSGFHIATRFFPGHSEWMALAVGVVAGILGALLALFLQRLAVGVAGFFAGGYIAVRLLHGFGLTTGVTYWVMFLIGGIIGLIVMIMLFDWALIILSSLVGAGLITENIPVAQSAALILFFVLFIAGILIQSRLLRKRS